MISTNCWGPNDIIENEIDGIKVHYDAEELPESLANAIEKLVNNQDLAVKMASKAKEKLFSNYTAEIVGKKLEEVCVLASEEWKKLYNK